MDNTYKELKYSGEAYYDVEFSMSKYKTVQVMLINSLNRIVGNIIIPKDYLVAGVIIYIPTMGGEIIANNAITLYPTYIQYYSDTQLYINAKTSEVSKVVVIGNIVLQ